mgnify:CR=1 FL=1
MRSTYESAKRIALGLEKESEIRTGEDLWNITLGESFSLTGEMPFQFFEQGFEPPEEQIAHKAALMLYEAEYARDCRNAEKRLEELCSALRKADGAALRRVLRGSELAEWLSLIFLDGEELQNKLLPLLSEADENCRAVFSGAVDAALEKLVDFTALMKALKKSCGGEK